MSRKPVELDPGEMVRHWLQQILNLSGDGWQLAQHVICMGLERVNSDGQLECTAWVYSPPDQADWMSDGLLQACLELRQSCEADDD